MAASMPNAVSPPGSAAPPQAPARRFRPRALPTLAMVAAVALCVVAGNWQQRRMHEKEALRAQLDAAMQAAPLDLAGFTATADWPVRFRSAPTGEYAAGGRSTRQQPDAPATTRDAVGPPTAPLVNRG
jgi:hypothetical protein